MSLDRCRLSCRATLVLYDGDHAPLPSQGAPPKPASIPVVTVEELASPSIWSIVVDRSDLKGADFQQLGDTQALWTCEGKIWLADHAELDDRQALRPANHVAAA